MSYQINHLVSTAQNMLAMLNSKAKYPIQLSDIAGYGTPQVITPNAGNGNNNTQIVVNGAEGGAHPGQTTIQYHRIPLSENRPSIGSRILMYPNDTLSSVRARVVEKLRLVDEEIVLGTPNGLPQAEESRDITLSPITNSKLYVGGTSMALTVHSTKARPSRLYTPDEFFGAPIATLNTFPVYAVPDYTLATYRAANQANLTSLQNFIRYLNYLYSASHDGHMFREQDFDWPARIDDANGFLTTIPVIPRGDSYLRLGRFYLRYNRYRYHGVTVTGAGQDILNTSLTLAQLIAPVRSFLRLASTVTFSGTTVLSVSARRMIYASPDDYTLFPDGFGVVTLTA